MIDADLTITEEPIAGIIETELWPLLIEHREELTTDKSLMVLAPNVEAYRQAEEDGLLFALVARCGGRIVGYSANFLVRHLHYMDLIVAQNDVLFVTRSARAATGLRLLAATRAAAKARGAQLVTWHAKPDTTLEAILTRRKTCRVQDIVFTERV